MLPADRRSAPIGPEVSWPAGYSDQEYRDGDYRYQAPQAEQLPPASHGGHPYAAFTSAGYGDDGYRDPGYQGPAAQDAGIAGPGRYAGSSRPGQGWGQPGYAAPDGYAQSSYQQGNGSGYPQGRGYGQPDYAGSSYAPAGQIEMAYPPTAQSAEEYHGADSHRQPWDYDQPLRYDDGEVAYQAQDGYPANGDYQSVNYLSGAYPIADYDGGRPAPGYDPDAYNGSDYSTPGIGGNGYDLAGIIGTSDFEAVGYDEPSYDRLAYDDPQVRRGPRLRNSRSPFDETRFDVPGFDETRLDNLWLPGDDVRQEAAPVGYGNDGFTDGPVRSGYSDFDPGQQRRPVRRDAVRHERRRPRRRPHPVRRAGLRRDPHRQPAPHVHAICWPPAAAAAGRPCSRGRPPSRAAGSRTRRSTTSPTSTSPTSRCPPPSPGPSSGPRPRTTPPPGARSAAAAVAAATGGSGWRSAPSPSSRRARSAAC